MAFGAILRVVHILDTRQVFRHPVRRKAQGLDVALGNAPASCAVRPTSVVQTGVKAPG